MSQYGGTPHGGGVGGPGSPGGAKGGKGASKLGGLNINTNTIDKLAFNGGMATGKPSKAPGKGPGAKKANNKGGSDYGSLATVPGRTRAPNFNRAPTLSELQTMGTIIGGVAMASPTSIIKGISDALSGTDFQGAVSKGSGEVEAKGQSGEGLSDEEKLKRKRLAQQTLLGSSGPAAGVLGTSAKPVKI